MSALSYLNVLDAYVERSVGETKLRVSFARVLCNKVYRSSLLRGSVRVEG